MQEQSDCDEMPLTPSANFLLSDAVHPPTVLTTFIEMIMTGKSGKTGIKATERTQRIAESIAEDICVATTRVVCKMRKHLLLGLAVHQLT